jgi:CRP-like cAMP-binding protein
MSTDILDRLRNIPIFSSLADNRESLERVAAKLKKQSHEAGSAIISEGDADQNIFFGEVALIDHDVRSATVLAVSDCETLTLSRKDYLSLCEEDPVAGFRITFQLALRLSATMRKSSRDMITMYQALIDEIS